MIAIIILLWYELAETTMFYAFDIAIFSYLNRFVSYSKDVNQFMVFASGSGLLKGGAVLTVLWWMWGKGRKDSGRLDREYFVATLMGSLIAAFTGRLLTLVLPFRMRPGYEPSLSFMMPTGIESDMLYKGWSSFPSDHAVLLCSLVAGIILAHRFIGILTLLYVFIVVGIPRVYLGMHYPTDFIVGAIIGLTIGFMVNLDRIRRILAKPLLAFHERYPSLFYSVFFLISVQIVTMFADLRMIIVYSLKLLGIKLAL